MEALGISSGLAGLLSLGITVCQGLLDYYGSWKDAPSHVMRMYASIQALTKTLKLLESAVQHEAFDPDIVVRVEDCIKSVEKGLHSLEKKLDKIRLVPVQEGWKAKAKSQIHRTLFPFKESTLAKLNELGNELRDDLSLALNSLQIDSSTTALKRLDLVGQTLIDVSTNVDVLKERSISISENVGELVSNQTSDHMRKVYDWLSPLSTEFERKQFDTYNIQNRQDGTAQWFLETSEFKAWLNGSGATLWCPGIPGTVKTVLASYIINHIQSIINQKEHRLAYVYFSYKDAKTQTVSNLLMSLVGQLVSSESLLPKELIACYEAHGSGTTRPSHAESTQLLRVIVNRYAKVFLIIDALDECSEECRTLFLTELRYLQSKMSILITSRAMPNVEHQLMNATRLEVQARSDDILQYILERIAYSEGIQSHVRKDLSLCTLVSKTLAARAGGMFLQARLHLDSLATTTTLRKLKDALLSLPEGLNKTYDETFRRVHAQSLDQATLARKALYWVFSAFRPLMLSELQHALAVETGDRTLDEDNIPDEGLLLSVCNGLLIHEGGFLSLVHYTLQEYLELKAEALFPEAQVEIVRTCLTYLSFDEFERGPCHLGDQEFEARLRLWPLLRYAVFKWGLHGRGSAEEPCKDLILSFLSNGAVLSASVQILYVRESMGLNYSTHFPKNVPSIWLASFWGLEVIVSYLLIRDKRSVLSKTTLGDTALHRAAGCGHEKVVQLLLEHGADSCAKDRAGNAPLHLATLFLNNLSAHDIRTSTLLDNRGRIAQQVRTLNYSLAVKQALLDHGADVNSINLRGESALHLAVCDGHSSLSRLLLESGADITLKDRNGLAPLSIASQCGLQGVTRVLLEYDLQRQIQLGILDDALRRAAHKDHLSLLRVLITKSPKLLSTDPEGRNLLHTSAFRGSLKCLEHLAGLGFDVHALDKQRRTCLHHAAADSGEAIELLLDYGLDPKQRDIDGWTPLVWAARGGPISCVRRLLDVSAPYEDGKEWMPYAVAMFHEDIEVAALLKPPDQTLPGIFGFQQLRNSILHPHVLCDGCDLLIYGSRYQCSGCSNFDYCFKCILSAKTTHPFHDFKPVYWDDDEQVAQNIDSSEVMKEVKLAEAMLTGGGASA